jgi:hypothetical protein
MARGGDATTALFTAGQASASKSAARAADVSLKRRFWASVMRDNTWAIMAKLRARLISSLARSAGVYQRSGSANSASSWGRNTSGWSRCSANAARKPACQRSRLWSISVWEGSSAALHRSTT